MSETPLCPDCGSPLDDESWAEELCPHCLLKLALAESSDDEIEADAGATGLTEDLAPQMLTQGQVLGHRYGIRTLLGRGGMGEVWRAFDLKLRVDVALKAVRLELSRQERVMETLRQEVRSAREVASPNVCRVYDLEEIDGGELVSMEYVEGETLLQVLRERGPLEIHEAREVAAQLLAGLEAIHGSGLVHRDLKPENVMITPMGRVVVMDFGIAKHLAEAATGTVAGTPAYMAPEQARGEPLDVRADVFSAGVMLAEMLAPRGSDQREARMALWRGVRQSPPQLPDSPWRAVIERAVAERRDERYATASALARALEEVTLRVAGAEDRQPYPGLTAFTEHDAEFFFGRELEAEALWKKLRRPHMLALIGPSGAGKTSFLRAGLVANAPEGWSHVILTPGSSPMTSLREALVPALSGDSEAVRELVRVEDPEAMVSAVSRWRSRSKRALLVVDQFEELFTLNPPEVQAAFSQLLGRLAVDDDVRVLLSMRDDFLFGCSGHESLKPILSELTLLGPPRGAALRRAIVQPALKCGYRFEDEALVDEMLAEVEGERGALPLLAFAAAELWERRDREEGLLTREAYEVIGGVGGALAQHAELTLERIGHDRIAVVREIFRNLVTARGTRAACDRGELLSVFEGGDRQAATRILAELVNARLLTSYAAQEDTEGQRIEIVHESLLTAWPRLVRWMAQDVEGAQLRDDLRQAARRWQERDRPDDLLWTGSAYREYQVWRERYPGKLSEIEEAYVEAVASLATRRRRRRRLRIMIAFAAVVLVAIAMGVMWRRSVLEARRAEAATLLTLGNAALGEERTRALAYAIASLERADTEAGRRLALEALWAGPPATLVPEGGPIAAFSPDGRRLAVANYDGRIRVLSRDGGPPIPLHGFEDRGKVLCPSFSTDSRLLVAGAGMANGEVRVWEATTGELVRTLQVPGLASGGGAYGVLEPGGDTVLTVGFQPGNPGRWLLHRWTLEGGPPESLGSAPGTLPPFAMPDLPRSLIAVGAGDELQLHRIATFGTEPARVIARSVGGSGLGLVPVFDPVADRVALFETRGSHIRLWPLDGDGSRPELVLDTGEKASLGVRHVAFSADGSYVAAATDLAGQDGWLWDLRGPASARPLGFGGGLDEMVDVAFSPNGRWLTTAGGGVGRALWPLGDRYPRILRQEERGAMGSMAFAADGSRLFVLRGDGVQAWPLGAGAGEAPEYLYRGAMLEQWNLEVDPGGRFLVAPSPDGVVMIPLDGGPPTVLVESSPAGALGPEGRLLAFPTRASGKLIMVVLNLETGQRREVAPPGEGQIHPYQWTFDADGRLLVVLGGVLSRSDPEAGTTKVLVGDGVAYVVCPRGAHRLLLQMSDRRIVFLNPDDGSRTEPPLHGPTYGFDVDPSFSVLATGAEDGTIRVQSLSGGEAHLILGHEGAAGVLLISPDGRWIASAGDSRTIWLWPMPDLSKPPLHSLPHDELMTKLNAMTDLRAVPDEESYSGYRLAPDFSAYHGWAEVPTW